MAAALARRDAEHAQAVTALRHEHDTQMASREVEHAEAVAAAVAAKGEEHGAAMELALTAGIATSSQLRYRHTVLACQAHCSSAVWL